MNLCRHQKHTTIDSIWGPKYSTDQVLISTAKVTKDTEHYLIKFKKCNQYPDWFYLSGRVIRASRKQPNGKGEVYAVSMSQRENFEPITNCEHVI